MLLLVGVEAVDPKPPKFLSFCFFFMAVVVIAGCQIQLARSDDAEALLALKSSIDPTNSVLSWSRGGGTGTRTPSVCGWEGVKECNTDGRVTKLVLEHLNLNGTLDPAGLNRLDQVRVLSFKGNSISGQIPDLAGLVNLKSLYLNANNFSGDFPASIASLHRLKVVVLAGNRISGHLPAGLASLPRLYDLELEDNALTGSVPPFNQSTLRYLNVSGNRLSGEVPATAALLRFDRSSFSDNPNLCGPLTGNPCAGNDGSGPGAGTAPPRSDSGSRHEKNRSRLIAIVGGSVGGVLLLLMCAVVVRFACRSQGREGKGGKGTAEVGAEEEGSVGGGGGGGGAGPESEGGFSWEDQNVEGLGSLVFCGAGDQKQRMSYRLDDLLKAAAEALGRGTVGSTYKAVMESGYIVTVKRLKDAGYPSAPEFRRQMELLGSLAHPNLVPLRAYFQAKEERLLVYDYFPNGSLFSLIHGSRTSAGGKPLHWTSCLKIAEDVATGLLYIHHNPGLTHGNLKSSNVLLGSDFESCLTDYGLTSPRDTGSPDESSAASLFYRAPECRDTRKLPTQSADVYSFGVLLLELLTGKTPFQDIVQEYGAGIPQWVRTIREEETDSSEDPGSGNEAPEEKLGALLNIAMACVSLVPENRPVMREVLKMVRDTRAEAQVSSNNSSDQSPGRWSDTVQSLPRKEQFSI